MLKLVDKYYVHAAMFLLICTIISIIVEIFSPVLGNIMFLVFVGLYSVLSLLQLISFQLGGRRNG